MLTHNCAHDETDRKKRDEIRVDAFKNFPCDHETTWNEWTCEYGEKSLIDQAKYLIAVQLRQTEQEWTHECRQCNDEVKNERIEFVGYKHGCYSSNDKKTQIVDCTLIKPSTVNFAGPWVKKVSMKVVFMFQQAITITNIRNINSI